MPSGQQKYFGQITKLLIAASITMFALACATIVSPTGGPKDITPPELISSQPANFSTNFTGNKLIMNFDEYIALRTPEKYLLISPPLSKVPELKLKGRSVVIKLDDSLRSNTTYNFYFGDAIIDITEGNPKKNFNFAFSTGSEIDSLSMSGIVTDAFTRMPVKDVLVMLYTDFSDSIPKKQIPVYVSRTAENGGYKLSSLASGKYRAVALVDKNSDYMYNLPNELIGFRSDSVEPFYGAVNPADTSIKLTEADRRKMIDIDLFPEPDSTQRILKSVIAAKNKLMVAFRYPLAVPGFRPLNVPDSLPWAMHEWNSTNDTLNAWLLNKPDTLKLEVSGHGIVFDTITISTALKSTGRTRGTETADRLKYTTTAGNRLLGYNKPLVISFANPVKEFDAKALLLTIRSKTDTTSVVPMVAFTDSIHRHLLVKHKWNPTDNYDLYIPKGAFTDIYLDSCDSTHVVFQVKPLEDYGSFAVTINRSTTDHPVIIQLLTEKGQVVDQRIITKEKRVDFGILPPAKYGLKAIMDVNGNGRWDTGDFLRKIQPEKVLIHPKTFDVKSNWELEENWDL